MSMASRVNPHALRVGVIKDWDSKWYAEDSYENFLIESEEIRSALRNKCCSNLYIRKQFIIKQFGKRAYKGVTKTLKKR